MLMEEIGAVGDETAGGSENDYECGALFHV